MMPLSALMGGFRRPDMPGMQGDPSTGLPSWGGAPAPHVPIVDGGAPQSSPQPWGGTPAPVVPSVGAPGASQPSPWGGGPVAARPPIMQGNPQFSQPLAAPSSGFPNPWGLAAPQQMPWQPNSSLSMLRGFF